MDWMCLKRETPAPVLVFPLDSGAKGIELRAESTMPLWKELLEGLTDQKDKKAKIGQLKVTIGTVVTIIS